MMMAAGHNGCEVAVPRSRSRRDALRGVLLVAVALAGLVVVRWSVTGGISQPIAPPAALAPAPQGPAPEAPVPAGTRLSLGGREPALVDPASGTITRIPPATAGTRTTLFRQGSFTVLVAGGQVWVVPAGRAGPRRLLGQALLALPALADDRAWLVDLRFGTPGQSYDLVEVGLADGRTYTHWTLPYQATPVAVLRSGVLARDLDGDLVVVAPGSGRVRTLLARAATFLDARGGRVAWLAGGFLHVRDLASKATTVVPPPPGSAGWYALGAPVPWAGCCYGLGAFAPGGRWLAVYAGLAGPDARGLAIVDLDRGRAALLPGSEDAIPTGCQPCLGWASNGWLFFFAAGPATSIAAWRPGQRAAGLLWLDSGRAFATIPSALAAN